MVIVKDILFKTDEYVFSYRVAGICIQDGKILLQKPTNDTAYAFPGGHVAFGETHEQTLIREFQEELGADITVGRLMWVGELFFPWGEKPCHQICLYYAVEVADDHTPREGTFMGVEQLEHRHFDLEFHWIPMECLATLEVYPTKTAELLQNSGVTHFIYQENQEKSEEKILP